MTATKFARFLSARPGALVSRFGTMTPTRLPMMIGASRLASGAVESKPEQVVALTLDEARIYRREYDREVRTGNLLERTEADYLAYLASQQPAPLAAAVDKEIS